MDLKEYRKRFPQYSDLSDQDLADGLHRKYYSDIPRADFDAKVGFVGVTSQAADASIFPQQKKIPMENAHVAMRETMARSQLAGKAEERPIDTTRPIVWNKDGSFSTERTITAEVDGQFYNIPTIVDGKEVGRQEAIDHAMKTGSWVSRHPSLQEADYAAVERSKRIGNLRAAEIARGRQAPQPEHPVERTERTMSEAIMQGIGRVAGMGPGPIGAFGKSLSGVTESLNDQGPAWSKVTGSIPTQIGSRIESKIAGTKEWLGGAQTSSGKKLLWQTIVMPTAVREAKEQGIAIFEHPDVIAAAQRLDMPPQVFADSMGLAVARYSPQKLQKLRQNAQRQIASGGELRTEGEARRTLAAQVAKENRPEMRDWSLKALAFDAATSIPDLLVGVGAGIATTPVGGVAAMAGSVAPEFYAEGKNEGLDDERAATYSVLMSLAEAAPELPVMQIIRRTPAGKRWLSNILSERLSQSTPGKVIGTAAAEGASEMVTEALQIGIESGLLDEQTSLPDALNRIARAGVIGAGMGTAISPVTLMGSEPPKRTEEPPGGQSRRPKVVEPKKQIATEEPAPAAQQQESVNEEPKRSYPLTDEQGLAYRQFESGGRVDADESFGRAPGDDGSLYPDRVYPKEPVGPEPDVPRRTFPPEQELAVLEAVKTGTATPLQAAQAVSLGHAFLGPTNEPKLLPSGRQRLTELSASGTTKTAGAPQLSQQGETVETLKPRSDLRAQGGPPQMLDGGPVPVRKAKAQPTRIPKAQPPRVLEAVKEQAIRQPEPAQQPAAEPQTVPELVDLLERDVSESISTLEAAEVNPTERMAVRRDLVKIRPLLAEAQALRQDKAAQPQQVREVYRRMANITGIDIAPMSLKKDETSQRGTVVGKSVEVEGQPSEAQKEAGNYRKGHVNFRGLDISIENLKGSTREGQSANGQKWQRQMRANYGYVRRSEGADGDHVDVFLGEALDSDKVFVIDQLKSNGDFDETKTMLGYDDAEQAKEAYLSHYPKGWRGLGALHETNIEEFKEWVRSSKARSPFAETRAAREKVSAGIFDLGADAPALSQSEEQEVSVLRSQGHRSLPEMAAQLRLIPEGRRTEAQQQLLDRAEGQQQKLRAGQRGVDAEDQSVQESEERAAVGASGKEDARNRLGKRDKDSVPDSKEKTDDLYVAGESRTDRASEEVNNFDQQPLFSKRPGGDKELVIQHNLSAENVLHAVRRGGVPVPSLAITKKNAGITGFGEITLVGPMEMADPRGYARTRVFGSDIYSPRYPSITYRVNSKALDRLNEKLKPFKELVGSPRGFIPSDEISEGPRKLRDDAAVKAMFLKEQKVPFKPVKDEQGNVADYQVRHQLEDLLEKRQLQDDYTDYVQGLFDQLLPVEKIFDGYTYEGNRKYKAHTLENVVRILKKDLRGGEDFNYGVASLRSHYAPQFKSLKSIVENKDRLMEESEFSKVKEEIDKDFWALSEEMGKSYKLDATRFGFGDTAIRTLEDVAKFGMARALAENQFANVPQKTIEHIAEFLNKLRNLPTEYFEAKILRAVDLAEFAGAIVPEGTSKKVIEALKGRGLEVVTYKRHDNDDRRKKLEQFAESKPGVLFRRPRGGKAVGIPAGMVRAIGMQFMRQFNIRPALHVVEDFNRLPNEVRTRVIAAGGRQGDIDGFYDPPTQTIYLVANEIDSEADIQAKLLRHEITHFGLRQVLTDEQYAEIMDGIARDMPMEVRRKGNAYGFDRMAKDGHWFRDQTLRRKAAEEVVAEAAEADSKGQTVPARLKAWLDRVIVALRELLKRMGISGAKYDRRYVNSLISQVHAHLRTGGAHRARILENNQAEAAFQRAVADHPNVILGLNSSPAEEDAFIDEAMSWLPEDERPNMHQRNAGFYSGLLRAAENAKLTKGSAQQWMGTLKNTSGIKQEELDWVGLEAWLKEQDGAITREQVVDFIAANQIRVEEKVLGDPGQETTLESEMETIKTRLRYAGYDPHITDGMDVQGNETLDLHYIESSSGATYVRNTEGDEQWVNEDGSGETLPPEIKEMVERLDDVLHDMNREVAEAGRDEAGFKQFTLPGGRDYRELLLTLPVKNELPEGFSTEQKPNGEWRVVGPGPLQTNQYGSGITEADAIHNFIRHGHTGAYRSAHFRTSNILSHVRFNERADADGKRVLFIEEIQSDWHQSGRKYGYRTQESTRKWNELKERMAKLDARMEKLKSSAGTVLTGLAAEEYQRLSNEHHEIVEEMHSVRYEKVPDAPFKTTWPELSFKRMVRWAAENGFDKIAWTTGQQQADRYSLERHIGRITLHDNNSGGIGEASLEGEFEGGLLHAYSPSGKEVLARNVTSRDDIAGLVGDELADKLITATPTRARYAGLGVRERKVEGLDMRIGGEGMKAFYDKMLPNMVYKLTRKWGAKVHSARMNLDQRIVEYDVGRGNPRQRFSILNRNNTVAGDFQPREEAEAAMGADVHAVDVTPAMREAALGGLPMFHRKSLLGVFRRRRAAQSGTFDMEEGSYISRIWNTLVFKAQDRLYDLLRLNDAAKKFRQISQIPDDLDAYLKETLFHGRVENRVDEYEKAYIEPLVEKIGKSGYSWQDVEDYLYARHAPEANLRYAEINPGQPQYNSGMTDEEAANIMTTLAERGDVAKLQDIGTHIDAMTKWYRDMLVMEGLEDQSVIQEWESTYQHYVPLKGWASNPELSEMPRRGRGFDTGGKSTKERTGRTSLASNILANIVAQAQMGLIRAEKARVGRALLEFVKANPAPRLYEVNTVEYMRYIDRSTGLVRTGINPTFKLADNVVRVRKDGKDEHIIFSPTDPQMVRLATAMKNLSAQEMNRLLTFMHGVNRYLSMVNTSLNIEFVISNAFRDIQTAMVNITATDAAKLRKKVLKNWRKAWNGIRRGELGKAGQWESEWKRFKVAGGKVGWIQNYESIVDLEKKLRRKLNRHGVVTDIADGIRWTLKWIERQNLAVENAIRLSTFKAATDAGISEERAAQIAKNLTVNFNKRGDLGVVLNSLYLFYNASIQGTAILLRTAKHKKARRIMYGIVGLGILMDILNRMIGGEDDDGEDRYDKIEEYKKERNIIIMLPEGSRHTLPSGDEVDHITIPLPYGYNFMYYLGNKLGGAVDYYGIGNKNRFEPAKDAAQLGSSFMGAFNPIGWDTSWQQMLAPTALDPFIQLDQNKSWNGQPIMPPQPQYDIPLPDSQRFFKSASQQARLVTDFLNRQTGGTEITPGLIDISPETLDHFSDFALGGVGRFVSNTLNTSYDLVVQPEDLELREIPMARRLLGQTGDRQRSQLFYERLETVKYAMAELEHARGLKAGTKTAEERKPYEDRIAYVDKHYPVASKLIPESIRAQNKLQALRKQRRILEEREGRMLESRRKDELEEIKQKMEAVMDEFNRFWVEVESAERTPTDTRDLIGRVGPMIEGKSRKDAVRAVRAAGMPALADLMASLPRKFDPKVSEILEREVV